MIKRSKLLKDSFNAFLLDGAIFCGKLEIPLIKQNKNIKPPTKLESIRRVGSKYSDYNSCVHFYEYDYIFDSKFGVWNKIIYNLKNKKGIQIMELQNYSAIISPDYSIYCDMPLIMQMWNVYRSRAVGAFLANNGLNVIPNVRWGLPYTYSFAFLGIEKGSIVSVGTHGCSKNNDDKNILLNGMVELIKRISPRVIMIYGPVIPELKRIFSKYNQNYISYDSTTKLGFERRNNG